MVEVPAPPAAAAPAAPATGRHAVWMLVATVVVALLNYALNIILGWALPLADYGRIGVIQTLIFIGTWFLSAGFPWVVSRALAQAGGAGPGDGAAGTAAWRAFKTAWLANGVLTGLVMGLLLGAFAAGWLPLDVSYAPLVGLAALTVGALGLSAVPDAGLQGLFRFGRIATFRVVEAVTNLVVSVVLVVAGFGAAGGLAGFAVAAVLACALNVATIRTTGFWRAPGWGGLVTLRAAVLMTVAVFGGVLLTNVDLLAIKFLSGAAVSDSLAGTYQVAAVLARAPLFIGTALVSTFYPRLAQEGPAGPGSRSLLQVLALGVLPINVVLSAGAPAVVAFFFPARFAQAAAPLALLAVGSALLIWAGGLAAIRQAHGQTRAPAAIMSLAVAAQIGGLAWAVPRWGALGAAAVSTAAATLAAGLLLAAGWRAVALPPHAGRQALALAVLAGLIIPLPGLFPGADRWLIASWIAVSLAAYLGLCFVLNLIDPAALGGRGPMPYESRVGALLARLLAAAHALHRLGRRLGVADH